MQLDLGPLWDENSQRFDIFRPAAKEIVKPFPCELAAFLMENNGFLYKLVPLGEGTFALSTLKGGIVTFGSNGKIIGVINTNRVDYWQFSRDVSDQCQRPLGSNNSGTSISSFNVSESTSATNNINGVSISTRVYKGRLYVGTFQDAGQRPLSLRPARRQADLRQAEEQPQ